MKTLRANAEIARRKMLLPLSLRQQWRPLTPQLWSGARTSGLTSGPPYLEVRELPLPVSPSASSLPVVRLLVIHSEPTESQGGVVYEKHLDHLIGGVQFWQWLSVKVRLSLLLPHSVSLSPVSEWKCKVTKKKIQAHFFQLNEKICLYFKL